MYSVSANKLAKASSSPARSSEPASRSYARAGRLWDSIAMLGVCMCECLTDSPAWEPHVGAEKTVLC